MLFSFSSHPFHVNLPSGPSFSCLFFLDVTFLLLAIFLPIQLVSTLDNGLARTPPMGWMSWAKFFCETDCQRHPFSCINEQLYKDMADRMAGEGYLDAGYEFVHIDDCWMDWARDGQGRLLANHTRFPSGIAALADYMHSRGLKLGIYEDIGTETCEGYPGSWQHFQADSETFASWKVDYLKLDGCNLDATLMPKGYIDMGAQLNQSGRPIVYSCSWPAYWDYGHEERINYTAIGDHCNLWRNYADIGRSWGSVIGIINFFVLNQEIFREAQGPGKWNDPDMIIVGNTELSVEQAKVQMAIWSIWSAPLIMSNDLRTILPEFREILLNKRVIAVDQDPLGVFGRCIFKGTQTYVFVKEIMPADPGRKLFSYAVAVLNYGILPIQFATDLKSIGLEHPGGYSIQDLWSGKQLGHFTPNNIYNVTLGATSVSMFKASLTTNSLIYE